MAENSQTIYEFLEEFDLDLQSFAESCKLSVDRVRAITEGRWTPSPIEREAIAEVFGIPKEEISWGHKTPIQHIYGHGPG